MTLLGSVIAKSLAFADYFLGIFASANAGGNVGLGGACGSIQTYDAGITNCGMTIANALAGTMEVGLATLNNLFAGLNAF
jgi:hypothetical protein